MINLSPKAIRFLIEALTHFEEDCERRMAEPGLSDDELADLTNDRQYLLALRENLQKHHDDLFKGAESMPTKI